MRSVLGMHRLRVGAMLVLAVLLAAQLALHNHSLIPEGDGAPLLPCVVCAFGADRITLAVPLLAAVVFVLVGFVPPPAPARTRFAETCPAVGRAPPRPRS